MPSLRHACGLLACLPNIIAEKINVEVCQTHNCCFLDGPFKSDSACAMDDLPLGHSTYIHTSGGTGCIAGDPYRFEVITGTVENRNKLVVFFQGGGGTYCISNIELSFLTFVIACFDGLTGRFLKTCLTTAEENSPKYGGGVFARENELNPYFGWTVVNILVCVFKLFFI